MNIKKFRIFILLSLVFILVGFWGYHFLNVKEVLKLLFTFFIVVFFYFVPDKKIILLIYPFLILLPLQLIEIGPLPKYYTLLTIETYNYPTLYPYITVRGTLGVINILELFFAYLLVKERNIKIFAPGLLGFIILSAFISIFFAIDKTIASLSFFHLILLIFTFLIYSNINKEKFLSLAMDAFLFSILFLLLPLIRPGRYGELIQTRSFARSTGVLFASPNTPGILVSISLPLVLSKILASRKKYTIIFYSVISILLVTVLVKTGSRNGLLSTLVAVGVWGILTLTMLSSSYQWLAKKRKWIIYILTLSLIVLLIFFYYKMPLLKYRLNWKLLLKDMSVQIRLVTWGKIIKTFSSDPLHIVGIGNFRFSECSPALPHAHNFFLNNLIEIGFWGALAILVFFFRIYHGLWKSLRYHVVNTSVILRRIALFASLNAVIVNYTFDMINFISPVIRFYTILLSLAVAYRYLTPLSED